MMEHSQPVSQDTPSNVRDTLLSEKRFGTWFAETIRASGRVRRANRPDTRLLLTSANQLQICLALQQLSTQVVQSYGIGSNRNRPFAKAFSDVLVAGPSHHCHLPQPVEDSIGVSQLSRGFERRHIAVLTVSTLTVRHKMR